MIHTKKYSRERLPNDVQVYTIDEPLENFIKRCHANGEPLYKKGPNLYGPFYLRQIDPQSGEVLWEGFVWDDDYDALRDDR